MAMIEPTVNVLPSGTKTAQPVGKTKGEEVNLVQLANDLREYTSRTDRALVSITEILNLLVRWLLPANYPAIGSGSITLTTTSQVILRQNPDRRLAAIINNDNVSDVYLNLGSVCLVSTGICLKPGGTFTFGTNSDCKYTGDVSGIVEAGTILVTFIEA